MKSNFLDWYTQALGSAFGILACIYAYLKGYMLVYGNIEGYFEFIGFTGVISSYLLLPLCIISFILSLIKSYTIKKDILNTSLESINVFFSVLTVIIGFMGAKIYFLIPAVFILFNILKPSLYNKIIDNPDAIFSNEKEDTIVQETLEFTKLENSTDGEIEELHKSRCNDHNILETKKEIAMQLLRKNSSKQFIMELTGFTLDEINMLQE